MGYAGGPFDVEDQVSRRAAIVASLALLAFSALTALALVGWFREADAPWTWKSVLATSCAVLALGGSALLWRVPARGPALLGIGVMLGSLARIGPPAEWTWASFALVAVTFVLLMPLVHAAIVLPDSSA